MPTMLPITSVVAAADNVRRRIGDVRDLAASITSVGIVEPLLASPIDESDTSSWRGTGATPRR